MGESRFLRNSTQGNSPHQLVHVLASVFRVVGNADGIITIHDFPEAYHTESEFEK